MKLKPASRLWVPKWFRSPRPVEETESRERSRRRRQILRGALQRTNGVVGGLEAIREAREREG